MSRGSQGVCHGDLLALIVMPPAGTGGPRGENGGDRACPLRNEGVVRLAPVWATVGGIEAVVRGTLRLAEAAIAERSGRTGCVGKNRGKRPGARRRRALARSAQAGIYPARDHHLFRLYRHQYPPDDLTQFLPRRDRHGRRPQRLSHRHPRGARLPAHLRRGASAATRLGSGHGRRSRRRRGRLLPLCRNATPSSG